MLKSKTEFAREARRKASAFSLQPLALAGAAFTLVEVLVVMVLLSFIVLALMAVFNSTQIAFRASLTQTDVLEGSRAAMGLITGDLQSMSASAGQSNVVPFLQFANKLTPIANNSPVNFCVVTNYYQFSSNTAPLVQPLVGSTAYRTNIVENFFILSRDNVNGHDSWIGTGYFVDTASPHYFNPLYRFYAATNVTAPSAPWGLYTNFLNGIIYSRQYPGSLATNASFSYLLDGVVHLTAHAYDPNGYWMTNHVEIYANRFVTNQNAWFFPPTLGEVSFYMFSNTLPASVSVEMGVLEDRPIQRAQSLALDPVTQSNYLAQQAGKVHLFRQRVWIRNLDPSAYP